MWLVLISSLSKLCVGLSVKKNSLLGTGRVQTRVIPILNPVLTIPILYPVLGSG